MKKKHFYTAVILLSFLVVGIQPTFAFYSIPSDTSIGTLVGRTFTLNTNVTGTIQIDESDLTLDGNGKTVTPIVGENTDGIFASLKTDITIMNVTIEKNLDGLGFDTGIKILQSDNITITDNTVSGCDVSTFSSGIYLNLTYGSNLTNNIVSYNSRGIQLSGNYTDIYEGNTLTNNTVSNNYEYAIFLSGSTYNTLTLNTISDNLRGIRILSGSNNNDVYNNYIIDNTLQASVTDSTGNVFNLPAAQGGGNYWSNWSLTSVPPQEDQNNDGFVDAPYEFTGGQDALPWANPNGPLPPPTPVEAIEDIIDYIELMDPEGAEKEMGKAVKELNKAIKEFNKDKIDKAIKKIEKAVKQLEKAQKKSADSGDIQGIIDKLVDLVEGL